MVFNFYGNITATLLIPGGCETGVKAITGDPILVQYKPCKGGLEDWCVFHVFTPYQNFNEFHNSSKVRNGGGVGGRSATLVVADRMHEIGPARLKIFPNLISLQVPFVNSWVCLEIS